VGGQKAKGKGGKSLRPAAVGAVPVNAKPRGGKKPGGSAKGEGNK
jgi:hypothetical protein